MYSLLCVFTSHKVDFVWMSEAQMGPKGRPVPYWRQGPLEPLLLTVFSNGPWMYAVSQESGPPTDGDNFVSVKT